MKQLLIPTIFFPYAVCLGAASLFSEFMMYNLFNGSISNILIPLLILWVLAAVCDCFSLFKVYSSKRRSRRVMREVLIAKCLHLPTYFVMCILGYMMVPDVQLVAGMVIMGVMALALVSVVSVYVIYRHYDHKNITMARCVCAMVCQFVPILDIVNLFSLYKNAKRSKRRRHREKYVVTKVNGKFAYISDENHKEVLVSVGLLPDGTKAGSVLCCENGDYTLAD